MTCNKKKRIFSDRFSEYHLESFKMIYVTVKRMALKMRDWKMRN